MIWTLRKYDLRGRSLRPAQCWQHRQCKNAAAYRYVVSVGRGRQKAMQALGALLEAPQTPNMLYLPFQRGGPLLETTILNQGLHRR